MQRFLSKTSFILAMPLKGSYTNYQKVVHWSTIWPLLDDASGGTINELPRAPSEEIVD